MADQNPQTDPLNSPLADLEGRFPALHLTRSSRFARRLGKQLLVLIFVGVLGALFVPWQQSIRGEGTVVAFDPNERPQPVYAQVKGLIAERAEGVLENAYVRKGDVLFVIKDQDPDYLFRLQQQVDFAETELERARNRLEQAEGQPAIYQRLVDATTEGLEADRAAQRQTNALYEQSIEEKRQKLAAQRNKVVNVQAKLTFAKAEYERNQNLFNEEVPLVPLADVQKAEAAYRGGLAELDIANQGVEEAKASLEGEKRKRDAYWEEWQSKITKATAAVRKAEIELNNAKIKIDKQAGEVATKQAKLQKAKSAFAAQQTQVVKAPLDGYILNLKVFEGAPVKQGEELCRIVPKTENPAVQVWVAGNDAPLIHEGDHVRLQFEGWPAVQFSGWPSVAVGTFGGTVALVDPTDNNKGKFRVLITPEVTDDITGRPWPEAPYLRQGVRANGWVLLDQVPVGYEVWRRMNGFPPALQSIEAESKSKSSKPPKIKI